MHTENQLHIMYTQHLIIWEATTYCNFSLLFHKKNDNEEGSTAEILNITTIMQKKKMLLTVFPSVTWSLRWKTYDSSDSWLPEITWDERGRKTQKLYL